jgi:hypothetical protein
MRVEMLRYMKGTGTGRRQLYETNCLLGFMMQRTAWK